uniref:Uncharacterized protein n=1 Tax=Glossina pallidipes TaxID=7398 RepID=A0A1B0AHE2_GLOPL
MTAGHPISNKKFTAAEVQRSHNEWMDALKEDDVADEDEDVTETSTLLLSLFVRISVKESPMFTMPLVFCSLCDLYLMKYTSVDRVREYPPLTQYLLKKSRPYALDGCTRRYKRKNKVSVSRSSGDKQKTVVKGLKMFKTKQQATHKSKQFSDANLAIDVATDAKADIFMHGIPTGGCSLRSPASKTSNLLLDSLHSAKAFKINLVFASSSSSSSLSSKMSSSKAKSKSDISCKGDTEAEEYFTYLTKSLLETDNECIAGKFVYTTKQKDIGYKANSLPTLVAANMRAPKSPRRDNIKAYSYKSVSYSNHNADSFNSRSKFQLIFACILLAAILQTGSIHSGGGAVVGIQSSSSA